MANFTLGVLAGLVASGLLFAIQWLSRQWLIRGINRAVPVRTTRAIVVIGGYPELKDGWPDDLFVHAEAVYAAKRLSALFLRYGTEHEYVVDREIVGEKRFELEVCVGGPAANTRTKYYLDTYCRSLYYSLERTLAQDEAVIVKLTLPDGLEDQGRVIVLLYGNVAFDTESAIAFFCDNFERLAKGELSHGNRGLRLRTSPDVGVRHANLLTTVAAEAFRLQE